MQLWKKGVFELLTSNGQLDELRMVLERPKIAARLQEGEAETLLQDLLDLTLLVSELPEISASVDPDDNKILAIAAGGKADLVVSGDRPGMLDLRALNGIPILTAREALEHLGEGGA